MLALRAVQRQAAASRSASPLMRVQHGSTGGLPRVILSRPLSTLAQTPSLRASLGHLAVAGLGLGLGVGFGLGLGFGFGEGLGCGFGLGEGQPQLPHAEIVVKKRKLRIKKRAKDFVVFEAIVVIPLLLTLFTLVGVNWDEEINGGFEVAFIVV